MGDLMHALPAITEAKQNIPNLEFDWVVDRNFKSVPKWHPDVNRTIETNHREWKLNIFSSNSRGAIKEVLKKIDGEDYDVVIDMQNNLKSAFLSYLLKSDVTGLDAKSSREFPAHLAYKTKLHVPKELHAIERQKQLLSKALGYRNSPGTVNYGISRDHFVDPNIELPDQYAVCVQNASWPTKQWSVQNWQSLVKSLEDTDIHLLFPSGNQDELERANEICLNYKNAFALDVMPLDQVAFILDKAKFAICSDTGLAHLSALTGTPSLTLYGPTNTSLIGTKGENQYHLSGDENQIDNITVETVLRKVNDLNFLN